MVNQQLGTNTFTTAKWIVSPTASDGTHTTIASALAAASSGDTIFIRAGTYTENVTLKAGVNLCAFDCDAGGQVTIVGKCSFAATGSVNMSGIRLQTNSDFCLAVTGSSVSTLGFVNCVIIASNNTAISFTTSNASAQLTFNYCIFDTGTTGVAHYSKSSTGNLNLRFTFMSNSGASSTANTNSAGLISAQKCYIQLPLTYSSSGNSGFFESNFDLASSGINATAITTSGTGTVTVVNSAFSTGTASAISVGVGTTVLISQSTVNSTNTNAITGAGTLDYGDVTFSGSSSTINTTTLVKLVTRPQFSTVNQVFTSSGTYTPTSGMVYCSVECLGGGGAGGGAPATGAGQFSGGGGGGGGEYARGIFSASTIGASQTVTIGAAGTGVSGSAGNNGGNTSLGALISANGGTGGTAGAAGAQVNAPGGLGGTGGTGGDFRTAGQVGYGCIGYFTGSLALAGQGASSQYGAGGQAVQGSSNGNAGLGHGSGGGGAFQLASSAATTGGNGTTGEIVIQEYVLS